MIENQVGKKVLVLIISALIGGGMGFLTAHLFIRRLEQMEEEAEQLAFSFMKEIDRVEVGPGDKKMIPPSSKTDYSSVPIKPSLDVLAEKYKPQQTSLNEKGTAIIPEEMWTTEERMGKVSINFYEEDSVFANEEDDPIEDPADLFGANIHLHFGTLSGDQDVVYVRNYRDLIDYEITRIHNSFSVVVMGEEPKKKNPSSRGKKKLPNETSIAD